MANKDLVKNSQMTTEQKAMALLICIAQEKSGEMTRNIKPFNLSMTQLTILHTLSFAPEGRLTVNQIKNFMIDDSPNVSRSLNRLMENGCIEKERSSEDQRVVYIKITEKGRQTHTDADRALVKIQLNLSEEDVNTLYSILSKI